MSLLEIVWGAVFGVCLGSFVTCAWWRLPRRMSLGGRSICPACGRELRARWNVPVIGWLALGGRAGCCGTPIPARYPLIEAGFGAAWALLTWQAGIRWAVAVMLGAIALVALAGALTARSGAHRDHF